MGFAVGRENWLDKNWLELVRTGQAKPDSAPNCLRSPRRWLKSNGKKDRTKRMIARCAKIAQMPIGTLLSIATNINRKSARVRLKGQCDIIHNHTFLENGASTTPAPRVYLLKDFHASIVDFNRTT